MLRLPRFRYLEPRSVADAIRWRAETGDEAAFVAGGTDLYPNMKRRQQTPATVISLGRLVELRQIEGSPGTGLTIGAGVTLSEVARHPLVRQHYRAVAHAAEVVSTPLLRNMGTIGGNLLLDTRCNYYDQTYEWRKAIDFCMKREGSICWVAPSSPRCWAVQSSDGVPVAVALGAEVTLASAAGERRIPAAALYRNDGIDYLTKKPDELLVAYHLPPVDGWKATYHKLRRRDSFDFPVLGVAARLEFATDGTVKTARIVLGAVASYPMEMSGAAGAIVGKRLDAATIGSAADAAFRPAKPMDNTDLTLGWRKEMVRVYVQRALQELSDTPVV
ncbi:MAG TPA: FAD binding domain-containing protein [Gemmatimonadaceae bacterium]|jgi:4-hydroxybenzoyl-CoA reductase subunit beta|nr:FAD binding domain-containing protein [Gemmatimonadaceae bacterium]